MTKISSKYHELVNENAARYEEGVIKGYSLSKLDCVIKRKRLKVNGKQVEITLLSKLFP